MIGKHIDALKLQLFKECVMTETIICALITGGLTLMGVLIANGKQQAITDTKLDELTREVREHNSFAQRVPVIEEQIKVINHRIQDLEHVSDR